MPDPPRRRRPPTRRTPGALSDEALERLAAIALEDLERAQEAWRTDASSRYRDLLDAVTRRTVAERYARSARPAPRTSESESPPVTTSLGARPAAGRKPFEYDTVSGRYVTPNGRLVPAPNVRAELDRVLAKSTKRTQSLATALSKGRITPEDWTRRMREEMRLLHTFSASAAKGGWEQMSPADFRTVQQRVKEQIGYLDNFSQQIGKGLPLDGRFMRRTELYSQAGRGTYHDVQRVERELRGDTEERNIRFAGDSCDGCIAASASGWVAIGTLPVIGSRDCLTRCRCEIEYR